MPCSGTALCSALAQDAVCQQLEDDRCGMGNQETEKHKGSHQSCAYTAAAGREALRALPQCFRRCSFSVVAFSAAPEGDHCYFSLGSAMQSVPNRSCLISQSSMQHLVHCSDMHGPHYSQCHAHFGLQASMSLPCAHFTLSVNIQLCTTEALALSSAAPLPTSAILSLSTSPSYGFRAQGP